MEEIDEKWLQEIGGWPVFKEARTLVEQGRVRVASREGRVYRGQIEVGGKPRRAGLRVNSRTDVDNLCPCPESRRYGKICGHSVAIALWWLRHGEKGAETPAAQPSPPRRTPGAPSGPRPRLQIEVSPDFANRWERGLPIQVKECSGLGEETPDALLALMMRWQVAHLPAVLGLDGAQAEALLTALAGTRQSLLADGREIQVGEFPLRPRLRLERAGKTLRLEFEPLSEEVVFLESEAGGWVWFPSEGSLLRWPTGQGFSAAVWGELSEAAWNGEVLERDLPWAFREGGLLEDHFQMVGEDWRQALPLERGEPEFALELEGSTNALDGRLRVAYGERSRPWGEWTDEAFPLEQGERWLLRHQEAEEAAQKRLAGAGFAFRDGVFRLRGERQILRLLAHFLPQWEQEWTIGRGERLKFVASKIDFVRPSVRPMAGAWGEDGLGFELSYVGAGHSLGAGEIARLVQLGRNHYQTKGQRRVVVDLDACQEMEELFGDLDAEQTAPGVFAVPRQQAAFLERAVGLSSGGPRPQEVDLSPLGHLAETLRSYQREGVGWLHATSQRFGGVILADDMGLGKTLQTLSLLELVLQEEGGTGLVVCPTSLLENWRSEAERFLPKRKVLVMHGGKRHEYFEVLEMADLVVTSYGSLWRDIERYQEREFAVVAADEASLLRNPKAKITRAIWKLQSPRKVALTGTPVENSVRDLWAICQFAVPGYLGGAKHFQDRYEKPLTAEPPDEGAARRLQTRMEPILLRRRKQEVLQELPEKLERIEFCELTSVQREVYNELLRQARSQSAEAVKSLGFRQARMSILTALLRLRQASCHLGLVDEKLARDPGASAKLDRLLELLEEALAGGHRVLLFSQFVSMLSLLREALAERSIAYAYLDGQTQDRGSEVARFQNPEGPPVFLISLKAGGYGLNLTAADTVIHFDPWWNPAVEAQATDRAHRLGQRKAVTACKLIARETVEERILALQAKKQSLIETAVNDLQPLMKGLSESDLKELLEW